MRTDKAYLQDILSACSAIKDFSVGLEKDIFVSVDSLLSATLWKFMIVGEAAAHISADLKERHPEVEWKTLAGFRNVLVHAYFKVNPDIVWDAIINRIEALEEKIAHIIRTEFSTSE